MKPSFRILSGSRAGFVFTPERDLFIAGRRAEAELRFSHDQDLAVSGRHAAFSCRKDAWYVRDLGSSNGTFVNGSRISAETQLGEGDRITFGAGGPTIELRLVRENTADTAGQRRGAGTVTRAAVRAAVQSETRRIRMAAAVIVGVVVLGAGTLLLADRREHNAAEAERARLHAQIDSLIAVGRTTDASLEVEVSGLRAALRESESRLQRLREEAAAVQQGSQEALELQRQLQSATNALRRQQLAATLDFQLIQQRNRGAVAMVWVEYTDGSRVTGTAFGVRPDGTLLTNRHLLVGHDGNYRHRRIAVRFSDSEQAFPARLLAVSDSWDLAAIRVDNILGDAPTIGRLNPRSDTLPAGAPLALLGFPLAGEPEPGAGNGRVARPLVSTGLVISSSPRILELHGLGAAGGSGSPIVDAAGDVVGVLFGGRRDRGVDVLVAVPSPAVNSFLATVR